MAVLLGACSGEGAAAIEPAASTTLHGGILATFRVDKETFNIWVTNPQTIRQILDLKSGKSSASIPVGKILSGPGEGNYNSPYSWHIDSNQITMESASQKGCDADPRYVENHLGTFLKQIKQYCPTRAVLIKVIDFRITPPGILTAHIWRSRNAL